MSLDFIHTYIPGESKRTLLLLHGTGGDENDLVRLGQSLDPAASILSPRGRVDEHGANRFFRRLREGVFDEDDLRIQTEALANFVTSAAEEYRLDQSQIVALGFSNGANIAAALMILRPEILQAAALLRAMVPLAVEPTQSLLARKVLILSGLDDPIIPRDNADTLAQMLRDRGADVTHTWLKTGHNLTQADFSLTQDWLNNLSPS